VDINTRLWQLASRLVKGNTKYIYLSQWIDIYIADLARSTPPVSVRYLHFLALLISGRVGLAEFYTRPVHKT